MKRLYEPPAYDHRGDGSNLWRTAAPPLPTRPAEGNLSADVAIVGGGLTGLSAALELRETHGADVLLLEAMEIGFGASGRAGGFCCLGGARIGPDAIERHHGAQEAELWCATQKAAIGTVRQALARYAIDADQGPEGETLLAHSPRSAARLEPVARSYLSRYGLAAEIFDAVGMAARGLNAHGLHGGLTIPLGFPLHPLKYTVGLAQAALAAGVRIHTASPVTALTRDGARSRLTTPGATIAARHLILATNGYSADDLPPSLAAKLMPVQSSILATRPLTEAERTAQGFTSRAMCYDSRSLLHYFRLTPDHRMIFGLRGARRATAAGQSAARTRARAHFDAMFPAWRRVETPHFWSGLIAMTARATPYLGPLPGLPGSYAALGFHGNGIAMGSHLGRAAAALVAGDRRPDLPAFLSAPMTSFPLGPFRRTLLSLAIHARSVADRLT